MALLKNLKKDKIKITIINLIVLYIIELILDFPTACDEKNSFFFRSVYGWSYFKIEFLTNNNFILYWKHDD